VSYPTIATVAGWLLAAFALLLVPGFGLHGILSRKATSFTEKARLALKPTIHWGPQTPRLRQEWIDFKRSRGYYMDSSSSSVQNGQDSVLFKSANK